MSGFPFADLMPEHLRAKVAAMTSEDLLAETQASIDRQRTAEHAALREENQRMALERAERLGVKHTLPKVYQATTWANVPASCPAHETVFNHARRFAEVFGSAECRGLSMMFFGPTSTGKTSLSCAVANAVIEAGFTVAYAKVVDVFNRIRDSFGSKAGESMASIMASLGKPDLLILDEVGRGYLSDAERSWLFQIIDLRYADGRSMLLISNLTGAPLRRELTTAGTERLLERCRGKFLEFTWPGFRPSASKIEGSR